MVRIWLPADAHRRLLEGLPEWAPAHRALREAPETHYAVGVRRVACEMPEAQALLKIAERVYPESAPLIRLAIRKASATPSPRPHIAPLPAPPPRSHDHRPRRLSLAHSLASVHALVFTFQILGVLDRARDVLRRLF